MKTELYTKDDLKVVAHKLLEGKIIAFPTDTVFGLACVYDDETAKNKIIAAKGRDEGKPLPMMTSKYLINNVAYINDKEKKLIDKFMPGAITIVFKKKNLEDFVTNGKDTVAIRVPNDEWILKLINEVNKPLLVTSANISNTPSLFKYEDVLKELDGRIDGVVKGNALGEKASTIVMASEDIKILRQGPISEEEIMEAINE